MSSSLAGKKEKRLMTIDSYKYSIQLFFDKASENNLVLLIDEFRSKNLINHRYVGDRFIPHISLSCYRDLDQNYADDIVKKISSSYSPFDVSFSYIGIFNEEIKVLFLGPIITKSLRNIHRYLNDFYIDHDRVCWDYYLPDKWVPHCGIIVDDEPGKIQEGLKLIMDRKLPTVRVENIAVVGFKEKTYYKFKGNL